MSFFDDFLEEEMELIVSLPYRVGLWISRTDDIRQTERDDEKEYRALKMVLSSISKEKNQAPFVSTIVDQTLTYQNYWDVWAKRNGSTLEDVARAVKMMEERLPEANAQNYRAALMRVANVVAHAYGEFEGEGDDLSDEMVMGGLVTKILDRVSTTGRADAPENVSAAEQAALQKLEQILSR